MKKIVMMMICLTFAVVLTLSACGRKTDEFSLDNVVSVDFCDKLSDDRATLSDEDAERVIGFLSQAEDEVNDLSEDETDLHLGYYELKMKDGSVVTAGNTIIFMMIGDKYYTADGNTLYDFFEFDFEMYVKYGLDRYVEATTSDNASVTENSNFANIYSDEEFEEVVGDVDRIEWLDLASANSGERSVYPYKVHYMSSEDFSELLGQGNEVKEIADTDYKWTVPVNSNEVTVAKTGGKWEVVGSGTISDISDIIDVKSFKHQYADRYEDMNMVCVNVVDYHTPFILYTLNGKGYVIPYSSRPDFTGLKNGKSYSLKEAQKILKMNFSDDSAGISSRGNPSETIKIQDYIDEDFSFEPEDDRLDAKPIIYLYPKEKTEISVKLGTPEKITSFYPEYNDGWNVIAYPDGALIDKATGRQLYALYWEGIDDSEVDMNEGFIVKRADTVAFLEEKLSVLGLTETEAEEFIIYWLPKLQENKYNFIRFATIEEINKIMPLDFSVAPDTLIRVLMQYKSLDQPITVKEQKLMPIARVGFTAVEWGGTEIR